MVYQHYHHMAAISPSLAEGGWFTNPTTAWQRTVYSVVQYEFVGFYTSIHEYQRNNFQTAIATVFL